VKAVVLTGLHPEVRPRLEAAFDVLYAGWAVTEPVVTALPSDPEIVALARDAQAVIVPGELSTSIIRECPVLRVIGVARGDPRGVDLTLATQRGIPVVYAAGRNAKAVAELTLGFIIMLLRKLLPAHNFVRERHWRTWDDLFATSLIEGLELTGRVLGLVGFGFVGQEVARRARAFDLEVLVYDPYVPVEVIAAHGSASVGLGELLARADIVSVHCKVTDETRNLLGPEQIAQMKPGAYFINTARAAVVDQDALLEALRSGRIAGAAFDVYWDEPLPLDSPLLEWPNVIHTPHIGGATTDLDRRTAELVVGDVLAVIRGSRPRFLANPQVWPGA
jgi:phosphoglycerate dehydrogenase-like enzyme